MLEEIIALIEDIKSKSQELDDTTIKEVFRDYNQKTSADIFSDHYTNNDIAEDKKYLERYISKVKTLRDNATQLEQILEKRLRKLD